MKNWPSLVLAIIAIILSLVMLVILLPVKGLLTGTTEKLKVFEESIKDQGASLSEVTEKISAFPDFSSYEKSIADLGERLTLISDQSEQLNLKLKNVENLGTQIEMLNQSIYDSVKRVEALEKAFIELRHLSGEKDAQISELTTKINQIETISTEIPVIKEQILSLNVDKRFVETAEKLENQKIMLLNQIEALKMEFKEDWQKNESEKIAFLEKLDTFQENIEKQKQDLLSFQNNWKTELEKLRNENQTGLATLQDNLSTQQNFIQTRIAEIEQLKKSLTQITEQIVTLDKKSLQVQELDKRVVDIDKYVKNVEEKMNTIKTSVETEVKAIHEQIENLSSSLQGMETSQQSYLEELTNVKNQSSAQLADLAKVLTQYETLNTNLTTIKNSLAETTSQFISQSNFESWKQQLEKQLDDSAKIVENLRNEMNTIKTSVETEVKAIHEQIENLSSSLQGMETSQQSYLEELTNASSLIHSHLNNLDSKTNVLESNLSQLEEAQKAAAAHSDQLEILVNGFNQSLEEVKNKMNNISGKINEQFEQIKKEISIGQEKSLTELKDQVEAIGQTLPDIESLKEIQSKISEFLENEKLLKEKIELIQIDKAMLLAEIEGNEKNIALLQENLEKIRNQQSTSSEAMTNIEEKIQSLQNQKDELANRLTKSDDELRLLESTMKDWGNKWEVMNNLLEKNTAEINQLIEGVKNEYQKLQIDISKKIDDEKLKTSLDTFNNSMNQVINRVATLEQFNQELGKKEIFSRVDAIEEKISTVEGRIDSIVQEYGISTPEIETLKVAVDNLKQEKIAIKEKIDLLFDALDGQKYIQETQQSLQSMNQEKDNLQEEIAKLSREKYDIEGDLQAKQKELSRIDQELEVLREEKQSAENIQKLEEEKIQVEKEMQSLTRDIENKLNQIEVLQKKIQELSMQLDESKKYTSYIILPWDNLWNIARRYYNDGTKWEKILEANSDIIDSPYNLKPYTEIKIPRISTLD
ncbi:MAG: LysM peptidoglycan-binding domain-containing protein [Candidatus Atribacteria bacterium]|nr:LysM peptidoglycan-binding domain-containing protein [Candidatus Atribacteria bacterium]